MFASQPNDDHYNLPRSLMTGKGYHRLLERQLKKFFSGYPEIPTQWEKFLEAISNSYAHSDNDRLLIETAIRESSNELTARKEALKELLESQSYVLEALRNSASSLFPERAALENEDLLGLADAVQREINKRQVAEGQKAQSDQRLLDIIDSLNLGMARYDLQGRLTHVERRFAELFGKSTEEMVGLKAADFPVAVLQAEELSDAQPMEFSFLHRVFESPFLSTDGIELWLLCTTAPLHDDARQVEGGVIVVFDITSRKNMEREMREAKKSAEAGLELRKTILANVSHELRTPINAIVGMSALLSATSLTSQQQEYIKTMRFSSDGLLVLIDDLLDVSRIEAGKVELEEVEFSLGENFTQLTKALQLRANEKGLNFEFHIDHSIAPHSLGDVHRLNQVITNLINNAIKFTLEGGVRLEIVLVENSEKVQRVRFSVSDTGIGIAADRQGSVFSAFTQEDSSTTRKYGGTGLGLAISRKIVELMSSELMLTSEKHRGSTFYFVIDLKKSESESVEQKIFAPDLQGSRVLLVEDNKVNQFLAHAMLKSWHAEVVISEDGLDAVERLKIESYDLVLMDLQMPVMDGFEATVHIREQLKLRLPIIGLSANALSDERERSLQVGMNDFVTKPFQPELLYEKIHSFIFG